MDQKTAIGEAQHLASLDSPFIIKYYDAFIEQAVLFIVMEYADKGTLTQYLNVWAFFF